MKRNEIWRMLWGMKVLGILTDKEVIEIDRRIHEKQRYT